MSMQPLSIPSSLVVETAGLNKSYGSVHALKSLDLKVARHSIFALLGPNGAGKTTTLKLLLGLIRPTASWAFSELWCGRQFMRLEKSHEVPDHHRTKRQTTPGSYSKIWTAPVKYRYLTESIL